MNKKDPSTEESSADGSVFMWGEIDNVFVILSPGFDVVAVACFGV